MAAWGEGRGGRGDRRRPDGRTPRGGLRRGSARAGPAAGPSHHQCSARPPGPGPGGLVPADRVAEAGRRNRPADHPHAGQAGPRGARRFRVRPSAPGWVIEFPVGQPVGPPGFWAPGLWPARPVRPPRPGWRAWSGPGTMALGECQPPGQCDSVAVSRPQPQPIRAASPSAEPVELPEPVQLPEHAPLTTRRLMSLRRVPCGGPGSQPPRGLGPSHTASGGPGRPDQCRPDQCRPVSAGSPLRWCSPR
jgi:hypothetical protein